MSDTLTYLMGNRWTKDVEGEFISVEDAYAVPPMNLSVDGKSTQVTTTGKNLLSTVESEWTKKTIPNVATRWTYLIPIEAGEKYTWSRGSMGKPGFYMALCDEDFANYESSVTLTNRATYTATNSNNRAYICVSYAGSYTRPQTIQNLTRNMCQIEKGSTATSYEPYSGRAASPRPDWPQEVKSVDAESMIYVMGVNLLNPSLIEQGGLDSYNKDSEVTYRCRVADSFNLDLFAGSTVSCIGMVANGTFQWDILYMVGKVRSSSSWLDSGANWTIPADATDIRLIFRRSDDTDITPSDFSNVQFEYSSTPSDYKPYSSNVAPLLPNGYSLRSLPNGTKDELYLTYLRLSDKPGWAWYDRKLVKRIAEFIADGVNEGWKRNHETVYYRTSTLCKVDTLGAVEFMSPQFAPATTRSLAQARNAPANSVLGRTGEKDMVLRTGATYATLADFTSWLSENPVTIYYPLETPVVTELDPIELPTMQSGLTNIWSDPSTNLSITYERDKNIVITNLKAAVDDLATS